MSEIKALDKLRKLTICDKGEEYTAYLDAGNIVDEIEAEIADMIERDYVRREAYDDLRDEFVWTNSFLHRMGKQCGTKDVPSLVAYVDKLEAERDEWKAKAEQAEHAMNKAAGNWVKADDESRNTTKQPISQFDVPKSEETTENVTSKDEIRNFDDTREKLEDDIKEICWGKNDNRYFTQKCYLYSYGIEVDEGNVMANHEGHVLMTVIMHLLDRQAAITEEKTRYKWVTASAEEIAAWRSKAEKLKERVYELTAERDEYREKLGRAIGCAHEIAGLA